MIKRGLAFFWASLRANWIPALGIWILGSLIVYDYYCGTLIQPIVEWVMMWRGRLGLLYPMLSMVLFAALLPTLTQMVLPAKGGRMIALRRLPWLIPYWAYRGLEVEVFYRIQAWAWGNGTGLVTVVGKVATDMFVYNPLLAAVSQILFLRLVAVRVGELPAGTKVMPRGWYKSLVVPLLIATWALWIPAVTLVYLMPLPLQLPLSNLIIWLWSMMLFFIAGKE